MADNKKLSDDNKALKEKNTRLQGIIDGPGGGSDKQPCRFPFGSFRFLLEIKTHKHGYAIEFSPNNKITEHLIETVDGVADFYKAVSRGKLISTREFEKLSRPIFKWSQKQKPECRFFAKVWDSEHFDKTHRRRITKYFYYKEIVNR